MQITGNVKSFSSDRERQTEKKTPTYHTRRCQRLGSDRIELFWVAFVSPDHQLRRPLQIHSPRARSHPRIPARVGKTRGPGAPRWGPAGADTSCPSAGEIIQPNESIQHRHPGGNWKSSYSAGVSQSQSQSALAAFQAQPRGTGGK